MPTFKNEINKMKPMFREFGAFSACAVLYSVCAAFFFAAVQATGAIVGPAGYTAGFGTQPSATDWATLSIAGAPTDIYNPDAVVNASVNASGVGQTVPDGGNPPGANGGAVWSSTGLYLQTRPTGNRATVLMGKFVNNTGTNATQITLSYLLTIAASGATEESGKGTRVYFSLTGAANSWSNLPALNITSSTAGSSTLSASVSLNWTNGGSLFLVWFDDNSSDGTDSANQYDNFSLRVTTNTPTNSFNGAIVWPTNRFLPTFPTPAANIDYIDITSASSLQVDLFTSLQGIVNRTQPRIACVSGSAEEGEFTWLSLHGLSFSQIDGFIAVTKYKTNVTGLVVTDPTQPDTLNLATTIAGLKNELICDPSLLSTLTNAPYSLTVNDDLRGRFSNRYQVYQYLYTNYWPQCSHRVMAGMQTNLHGHLRDYLVAVRAAVVWLNPGVPADAAALAPFVSSMAPVGGVYLGWWPSENAGLTWIGQFGIPVVATDFYENGSLFGGVTTPVTVPPIPPGPPLQNKVYVSITLSDGDNIQYMQRHMKVNWGNSARGSVPIGWTAEPLAADMDPGMLNYYWSTATTNDCLVAGPSGAGYGRLNYWGPANLAAYARASDPYFQRSGMRSTTIWDKVSKVAARTFAAACPTLLGVNDFGGGNYVTNYGALPVIGFPGSANYASSAAFLLGGITNAAGNWTGSAPLFIAVEGSGWDITPADCQTVANALNTNQYVVVRPDHQFMLYRQAAGLVQSGAPRIIEDLSANLKVPAGFALNPTIYPVGERSLSYQWQFNGTNLTNNSRIGGAQTASLIVAPAFTGDAGQYQVIVFNSLGSATSTVCNVTIGRDDFSAAGGWSRNGNAGALTNSAVTLTDGRPGEASSVFLNSQQYVGAFKTSFTYQDIGGGGADGCAFVLHSTSIGPLALGGGGGSLGYSGISPSVAIEFNIYSGNGVGMAIRTNGQTGPPYSSTAPVNLAGGNPIGVSLAFDGSRLSMTLTDMVSHATFSTNSVMDLVAALGTNTAYVGITAADGGISSTQIIKNFQFASLSGLSIHTTETNAMVLTWPNSAGGFVLQQSSSLGPFWTTIVDTVFLDSRGNNRVTIPAQPSTMFYRLATP